MFQLLQGWRRKCGAVILLLTCLFAMGWVKSRWMQDLLEVPRVDGSVLMLRSHFGRIELLRWTGKEFPRFRWDSYAFPTPAEFAFTWQVYQEISEQQDQGPDTSLLQSEGRYLPNKYATGTGIAIPYRSLVFPLLVISAYLLLSGRHRPKRLRPDFVAPAI